MVLLAIHFHVTRAISKETLKLRENMWQVDRHSSFEVEYADPEPNATVVDSLG